MTTKKWEKTFIIHKGEYSRSNRLNSFLDGILEEDISFWKGKIYIKNYKIRIVIEELKQKLKGDKK